MSTELPEDVFSKWVADYAYVCVCAQSYLTLCDRLDCRRSVSRLTTKLLCSWNFISKKTGVSCSFLFQGNFLTQGSNSCLLHLLHWQADSLLPCHLNGIGRIPVNDSIDRCSFSLWISVQRFKNHITYRRLKLWRIRQGTLM